jgi:hypothetical protein
MTKKKDEKEVKEEKNKVEKKVVNKDTPKLYSLEELAEDFGYTQTQMRLIFSVRGIDRNEKLSIEDARKIFKDVMI